MIGTTLLSTPVRLTEISLVPGPRRLDEPAFSFAVSEMVHHSPEAIAVAILSYPGTRLLHPGEPKWVDWQARWERGDHHIDFDMTLMTEDEPLMWGGSMFSASCRLSDVLAVWERIASRCPGVWLHDASCRLYSPQSFAEFVWKYRKGDGCFMDFDAIQSRERLEQSRGTKI